MPVLFVGHGSPMNVIEDSPFRRAWQDLGAQFGVRWPKPKLILCISAHWITEGWWMTGMAQPKIPHPVRLSGPRKRRNSCVSPIVANPWAWI
jgi:4,5-DOPA dioxygenase extradiol